MLNAVIRFALRYRVLIVFVSLAALLYGSYTAATLPIDVFPDLDRPRVVIMTEAPGYAPEDVETLITFPLEAALNGATGVESVRSQSGPSLSVIYVNFGWSTNIYTARQIVQERLNTVEIPKGVTAQMAPISSIMGQIILIGMHRRPGPHSGTLAPVGRTGYLAELVTDPRKGRATLYLWDPPKRGGQPQGEERDWKPVTTASGPVSLQWSLPGSKGPGQPTARARPTAKDASSVLLPPRPDQPGTFSATDPRLKRAGHEPPFSSLERRARVTIKGTTHEAVFPTALESQLELRTLADWVVRLRLLKISGVAQVVTMGGGRKQYQVLVNPHALVRFQVSLDEIKEALRKNNLTASGGWAEQGDKEKPIRFMGRLGPGRDKVLAELAKIPVRQTEKRNVLLGDVARVVEGPQIKRGDSSVNGQPGVVLTLTKQPHVDTRALTGRVEQALHELEATLPADVVINPDLFQMKRFIDLGVYNVGEALLIGAALVLVILFLFLLNFRTTFISLTAIPLSLAVTALVFRLIGKLTGTELSINVMTLGGIAVAIGELVDDAIVDVENIFRRLKENNALPRPRPALRVIYEASVEVRSAIVFGTAMVILVFIPLFALSGIEGRLFAPLGVAYIVSILASLLVSLTVTPVLSYYLLPQARAIHREKDSPLLRALKWGASYLVRFSMRFAGLLLLCTWLLVGLSVWMLAHLGSNFLPPFDEGTVQVNVTLPAGSSLQASNHVAAIVDVRFRQMQKSTQNPDGEILHFVRRTGRAELDEHAEPVSKTEYLLTMNPEAGRSREAIIREVLDELKELQLGAGIEVEQPLAHLISHMLSGVTAQIAIKVYGDDLEKLKKTADQIKAAISSVEGIAPPVVEAQQLAEELHIRPKPDALALYGVDREHLGDFVRTAMYGDAVSQVVEGERRFDLLVRLDEPFRTDYDALGRLLVHRPGKRGEPLALEMLADIGEGLGPNVVNREDVRRRIVIRVNTLGRDLGSVVQDIRRRIEGQVTLPQGYFVEYGGQFESQQRATSIITILAGVALLGMFAVLYMLYPSTRVVLQILNALPTAFIGGVLALWLSGQTLTVASMVGFISLGGIAARNGILLVTHYFHLMKHEGESFTREMVLRGSLERLSPVLMTALTAGIALIPLVVAGEQPGREILYPVATVILGGLITSTFCEFLIHPGLFWKFSGKDASRLVHEREQDELVGSVSPALE
jgi:CzcA family heavy metal efflux pump